MFWWVVIGLVVLVWWLTRESKEIIDLRGKSVFISGCDTGFGHALALRLDKLGLKVFAGCLSPKGATDLKEKASSQLETIICDITKEEDIKKAAQFVENASPNGLWALVNNAGIGYAGEWDWILDKHIRLTMEVNFFGHVAVTRAFLHLIKKSKGRIVNLTSIAGVIAPPMIGPYTCSKFAMEAFSDSLRREMKKWGVSVFIVEPGFTDTPMISERAKTMEKIWNEISDDVKKEYGEAYGTAFLTSEIPLLDSPEIVLDVLQSKVICKNPALRTRVGPLANFSFIINNYLPASITDTILRLGHRKIPLPEVLLKKEK